MEWEIVLNSLPTVVIGIVVIIGIYFRVIKKVPFEKGKIEKIGYFDDLPDSVLPEQPDYEKIISKSSKKEE